MSEIERGSEQRKEKKESGKILCTSWQWKSA